MEPPLASPPPLEYARNVPELRPRTPRVSYVALFAALAFLAASALGMSPGLHNEHEFHDLAMVVGVVATLLILPAWRQARARAETRAAVVLWLLALVFTGVGASSKYFGEDPHMTTRRNYYCLLRLRQIGQAMTLYANDHQGKFPDSLGDLLGAVPDIDHDQFYCPAVVPYHNPPSRTRAETISDLDYGRNTHHVYLAKGLTDRCAPDTVLAHDHPSNWSAHGGGMTVLFADGVTVHLDRRQTQQLTAELNADHNPPHRTHFTRPP
jgi:prepilin-type processing-associated H-X9-DG protein